MAINAVPGALTAHDIERVSMKDPEIKALRHAIKSDEWKDVPQYKHVKNELSVIGKLELQGLSEPEFYGDLVYKFGKIIGKNNFPCHFKKIIVRYKKIGYNINVMRQTACLVVNPIKVNSFAYLFNCTTVGRTSD